jgi:DNA polymerase III epsilon subunit family exonuclease
MPSPFANSLFSSLIAGRTRADLAPQAIMGGVTGSRFALEERFAQLPLVVFDFETTGLDTKTDRIIEIGAVKYKGRNEVARYSQLVDPGREISEDITCVTGITQDMLVGQPSIADVLPSFHDFLRGCVGVAHNAEFDTSILSWESTRLGIQCDYFVVCTLRMARELVKSERKNLDALAAHYGLSFESRHRSIGDILVTASVLWHMLDENRHLVTLRDFSPFQEVMQGP